MKAIQETKLEDLVKIASDELLQELRSEGVSQIKKLFNKVRVVSGEIARDEVMLEKKKESLMKTNEIIEKLKKGDWSVLQDNEKKNDD